MRLDETLLLTDLYELSMLESYFAHGMVDTAVFELFVRTLPAGRGFLMAAGLEQLIGFLERMRLAPDELVWLRSTGRFTSGFVDRLAGLRFTGDVDALPEGTLFFPNEPIVRITAPLPEAQIIESRLINLIHFQTVVASKAVRMVLTADGNSSSILGSAGHMVRRPACSPLGQLSGRVHRHGDALGQSPLRHPRLRDYGAFLHPGTRRRGGCLERFARARPKDLTLLIATHDTERAASLVTRLAPRLAAAGITVRGVRLDSGDLAEHARQVRRILDEAGLAEVAIFASGGLDETVIQRLVRTGAPIDGFGVGTSLAASSDAPVLDCAYKLQEYAGEPRRKHSEGKATWPGRKQVHRRYGIDGTIVADVVALLSEPAAGEGLLRPAMRGGVRVSELPDLEAARARAATSLLTLPPALRRLEAGNVPVEISAGIRALAAS